MHDREAKFADRRCTGQLNWRLGTVYPHVMLSSGESASANSDKAISGREKQVASIEMDDGDLPIPQAESPVRSGGAWPAPESVLCQYAHVCYHIGNIVLKLSMDIPF